MEVRILRAILETRWKMPSPNDREASRTTYFFLVCDFVRSSANLPML